MQHALLGLAIALIVAIAAALAAPAFVDWNNWRAAFEQRASALVGAPVRIRGRIEATILPTPAFVLREVEIGDPERSTGVRAGEVRGILSLGALLRGAVEAEEFVLAAPAMRLAIEPGGRPVLPAASAAVAAADLVAYARIEIAGGSLVIEDRGRGELVIFDQIAATGEMRARRGPMRIDAAFRHDGRPWRLRANAGHFGDDGTGRVRLTVERAGDGALFDADGTLALAGGPPRFEGRLTLARRGAPEVPWRIAANARASEELVTLESFDLALGADESLVELSGQVQFAPRRGGRIEGSLMARRLDVDRAIGGERAPALPMALRSAGEALALLKELPLQGRIGLALDTLVIGSGMVRELKADLALREGALALERLEARLPGRGSIAAAGVAAGRAAFSGDVAVEAEDGAALARWALGDPIAAAIADSGRLRLSGQAEWSDGRVAIERLEFVLGDARLGGRFALTPGESGRRARIETRLTASGIDLDLLAPVAQLLQAGSENADLALEFAGSGLRALGRPARRIEARLQRSDDGVAVERLRIEDFDGLSAGARGRLTSLANGAGGRIDFELEAARPDGLAAVAAALAGEEAGLVARQIAAIGAPLKLAGTASGEDSASGIAVAATGRLSDIEASLEARFDPQTNTLAGARVVLEARESGKLVSLFGITPGPPTPGDGRLEAIVAHAGADALPLTARLSVPGANLTGEGVLHFGAGNRIEPQLDLRLAAADLRPLLAAAARAGGDAAVPADGSARLVRTAGGFALENLALNVGHVRVHGGLAANGFEQPAIAGKLAVERVRLVDLLALALGSAREGDSFWPAARLGTPPLEGVSGAVELEVAVLALAGPLAATDAKFKLRFGATDAAIEEFSAAFAGGLLAGHARFVRGETLAFDGRAMLSSFEIERVLAPGTWRAAARGGGTLVLTLAGNGRTPAALAASLAGQGRLALESLEIDRLDPNAITAVLSVDEEREPHDEVGVIAALAPAFANGPLRLSRLDVPFVVASGVARTGKVRAVAGPAQVTAEASVDLARLAVDGTIQFDLPPPQGMSVQPAASVRWRGPLAAPERGIDAAALATVIALRAMEREQKRIEERERLLREERERLLQEERDRVLRSAPPEHSESPSAPSVAAPAAAVAPSAPSAATPDPPLATEPAARRSPAPAPAATRRSREPEPARATVAPSLPPPMDIRPMPPTGAPQ